MKRSFLIPILLVAVVITTAVDTYAQSRQSKWRQTVTVYTRLVGTNFDAWENSPVMSLLKHLDAEFLPNNPDVVIMDGPDGQVISYDQLSSQFAMGQVAAYVRLVYRFEFDQYGYTAAIQSVEAGDLSAPIGGDPSTQEPLPRFYIDATQEKVTDMLLYSGSPLPENEFAFKPFYTQIMLPNLAPVFTIPGSFVMEQVGSRRLFTVEEQTKAYDFLFDRLKTMLFYDTSRV